MTGKKPRPDTEPIYSGGNRNDFPITTGYDSVKYTDFISSHIRNSENIVICQNFDDGYFSGFLHLQKGTVPGPPFPGEFGKTMTPSLSLSTKSGRGKMAGHKTYIHLDAMRI